jgi:hypothetical protein
MQEIYLESTISVQSVYWRQMLWKFSDPFEPSRGRRRPMEAPRSERAYVDCHVHQQLFLSSADYVRSFLGCGLIVRFILSDGSVSSVYGCWPGIESRSCSSNLS